MRLIVDYTVKSRALAFVRKAIRRGKAFIAGHAPKPERRVHEVVECKEIVYRGGIVRFKIPKHWVEEYQPEGGAMFYVDHPDTSILRLQVVTFESERLVTTDDAVNAAVGAGELGFSDVVVSPEGNAIAKKFKRTIDDGEEISIHFWCVANPIAPQSLRIAHFSFTILTSLENAPETLRDLALLNDSIEHAEFHPATGISGDYFHDSE